MGVWRDFRCPSCDYATHVSGGPDMGMSCATQTILCKQCEVIGDVVVQRWEHGQFPAEDIDRDDALLECPADASHDVVTWSRGGPCPRCGAAMEQGHERVMWD
jgi:hypothetical protein